MFFINFLDLSDFTSYVKDMSHIVFRSFSLIILDLSNFNINNVKNMDEMFLYLKKNCNIFTKAHKILNEIKKAK